jgi:pyruvate formate lyase activating enzyme
MDEARHRQQTGAGNGLILDNLQRLAASGAAIELRLALIPGVNDDEDNLRATADFAASLPALREVRLLPYHDTARDKYGRLGLPYRMAGTAPPGEAKLAAAGEILRGYGLAVLD